MYNDYSQSYCPFMQYLYMAPRTSYFPGINYTADPLSYYNNFQPAVSPYFRGDSLENVNENTNLNPKINVDKNVEDESIGNLNANNTTDDTESVSVNQKVSDEKYDYNFMQYPYMDPRTDYYPGINYATDPLSYYNNFQPVANPYFRGNPLENIKEIVNENINVNPNINPKMNVAESVKDNIKEKVNENPKVTTKITGNENIIVNQKVSPEKHDHKINVDSVEIDIIFKKIQTEEPAIVKYLVSNGVPHHIALDTVKKVILFTLSHHAR